MLNINSFLEQLVSNKKLESTPISDGDFHISLPGKQADSDITLAFDLIIECNGRILNHNKGIKPVALQFFTLDDNNDTKEINVIIANFGTEKEIENFASANLFHKSQISLFFVHTREQIKKIRPKCQYSYVMKEGGKIIFLKTAIRTKNVKKRKGK